MRSRKRPGYSRTQYKRGQIGGQRDWKRLTCIYTQQKRKEGTKELWDIDKIAEMRRRVEDAMTCSARVRAGL